MTFWLYTLIQDFPRAFPLFRLTLTNTHTHAQVNYAHEQSKNIRSFLFSTWPRHFRHFRALVFSIGRRLAVVQKVADYDADAVAAVQLRKGQRTMGQNQVILKH